MPNKDPLKRKESNRKAQATFRINHPDANREYHNKLKLENELLKAKVEAAKQILETEPEFNMQAMQTKLLHLKMCLSQEGIKKDE